MLKIGKITLGVCQTNCYFIYDEQEKKALVVDPADQGEMIYNKLKNAGITIAAILLTHGHYDHIWGVKEMKELSGVKVYAYKEEKEVLESPRSNLSTMFGNSCTLKADVYLEDQEEVTIENITFKTIWTKGHTKGSCCFYFEAAGMLLSGDTLFEESVGRTDFPTGSMSDLVRSVKEKLFVLPREVKVYPGHMGATTIGYEMDYNPSF